MELLLSDGPLRVRLGMTSPSNLTSVTLTELGRKSRILLASSVSHFVQVAALRQWRTESAIAKADAVTEFAHS